MNGGTISCGFGCDIFFLSYPPLSLPFFFLLLLLPALLEDVLECTAQAFPVFPCGPSAAAVQPPQLSGWRSQFATHTGIPLFSRRSHLTSQDCRLSSKIKERNNSFFFKPEKNNIDANLFKG